MQQPLTFTFVSALTVAVAVASPRAQNTFVSPVTAATSEGPSNNGFPFNSVTQRRYMQIHGDTTQQPMAIRSVAWRANGGSAGGGPTTFDLEMFMGLALAWDRVSYVISNNYVAPPTRVVARRSVNLGPSIGGTGPTPFSFGIALDAPYPYAGGLPLVWEVHVHAGAGGLGLADADASTATTATSSLTGTGCTANGAVAPMTQLLHATDMGGTLFLGVASIHAPPSALSFWAIGTQNLNVQLPGMCSAVLTDLAIVLPLGLSTATGELGASNVAGSWIPGGPTAFALPNIVPGALFYSQVHALDVGSTFPIAIANSEGRSVVIPSSNTTRVVRVTRLFNNFGGTSEPNAVAFAGSTVGYGIVTQFTY